MPQHESDKVQREIEELLNKLDNFVPEDRLASKIRNRQRVQAGPGAIERLVGRITRLSLGHVLLAGLALLIVGSLLRDTLGALSGPMIIAGIVLAISAFVLSVINGDSRRTIAGGRTEKRWRGQVIDYSEPSAGRRLMDWLRRRRR
jgi:hypothetical protein